MLVEGSNPVGLLEFSIFRPKEICSNCKVKYLAEWMAILALITSGNNYVGLGSRRGGGHPPPAGLE